MIIPTAFLIYAVPSIIALSIKLYILFNTDRKYLLKNKPVLLFFASLFITNSSELAFFFLTNNLEPSVWLLRVYYASAIIGITAAILFSSEMANIRLGYSKDLLLAVTVAVFAATLTPLIIVDAQSIGYSITRIPGQYFYLVVMFLLVGAFVVLSLLWTGSKQKNNSINAKRCQILLFALSPIGFIMFLVFGLMSIGIKINATIFLSLSTSVMLITLIYTESKHHLFLIVSYFPWTQEYQYRKQLNTLSKNIVARVYKSDLSIKAIQQELEKTLINIALGYTDGNLTHAAKLINMPVSTMGHKIKVYNLD